MQGFLHAILVYGVLPAWLLAGFADYLCHRAVRIEIWNGPSESILHWIMLAEVGVPLMLVLLFRNDALLFLIAAGCYVSHEITTHFDLKLANDTRDVSPFEQQVHSLLEMLPLTALLILAALHWEQAEAIFGVGPQAADWSLTFDPAPTPSQWLVLAVGLFCFGLIPYGEELYRGWTQR